MSAAEASLHEQLIVARGKVKDRECALLKINDQWKEARANEGTEAATTKALRDKAVNMTEGVVRAEAELAAVQLPKEEGVDPDPQQAASMVMDALTTAAPPAEYVNLPLLVEGLVKLLHYYDVPTVEAISAPVEPQGEVSSQDGKDEDAGEGGRKEETLGKSGAIPTPPPEGPDPRWKRTDNGDGEHLAQRQKGRDYHDSMQDFQGKHDFKGKSTSGMGNRDHMHANLGKGKCSTGKNNFKGKGAYGKTDDTNYAKANGKGISKGKDYWEQPLPSVRLWLPNGQAQLLVGEHGEGLKRFNVETACTVNLLKDEVHYNERLRIKERLLLLGGDSHEARQAAVYKLLLLGFHSVREDTDVCIFKGTLPIGAKARSPGRRENRKHSKDIVCRYHGNRKGGCRNGSRCRYRHDDPSPPPKSHRRGRSRSRRR